MRLLITGAGGFLGKACVLSAQQSGHEVLAVTRSDGDLDDPAAAASLAKKVFECDALLHVAAKADFSCPDTHEFTRTNVVATSLFAEACAKADVPMVFASAAVIAASAEITPDSMDAPAPGYIKSKWLGEQVMQAIHPQSVSLRFGGIYGAGGPSHLGLNSAIDNALKGLCPTIFGDGSAKRNYVHVGDAAKAMIRAATEKWSGIHLIANHEILSVASMMSIVSETLAGGPAYQEASKPSGNDMVVVPSPLQPMTRTFQDVISEYSKR